jgi:hypothetical protein
MVRGKMMYTRSILLVASASFLISCEKFDTTRVAPATGTVGQELFGIMCDRLVAQNFPEDIEGKRFEKVCHPRSNGKYDDLPEVSKDAAGDDASEKTRIALARIEALSKRRADLIKAFDTMLPEAQEGYLSGMRKLLADMTPLYDRELPNLTKSTNDVLAGLENNPDALNALTRIINRDGYRPLQASAGLLSNIASRPEFGDMLDGTLRIFEPGGENDQLLAQMLVSGRDSLRSLDPKGQSGTFSVVSRVLLTEDNSLFQAGPEMYVTKRDACGVAGFGPGAPSFMSNACQQVDVFGRFVDKAGALVLLPTPFSIANVVETTRRDNFGRALDNTGRPIFNYVNLQKSILPGLVADSRSLMAPEKPFLNDLLLNLAPVLGDASSKVETLQGDVSRKFDVFSAETSPAVDLAIAAQPVLAALSADNFDSLDVLSRGLKRNENNAARLLAAFVNAKNLANADTYANSLQTSPLWDEILDILVEVADARDAQGNRVPLLEELLEAFLSPELDNLSDALSGVMNNKDIIDYDTSNLPASLNNPPKNYSAASGLKPSVPVERNKLDAGENRSLFQRLAKIIHEARGVRMCNKGGADGKAYMDIPGLSLLKYDECELFDVPDMATFFLQAVVVNGDENSELARAGKGRFPITDPALRQFLGLPVNGQITQAIEQTFSLTLEAGSGITGLGIYPTPGALSRLLFVRDADNTSFAKAMAVAAPSRACALRNVGTQKTADGVPLFGVRQCAAGEGIAERNPGTLFAFETNNFYAALRVLGTPFVKYNKEDLFLRIMSSVTNHWPSASATDCVSTGTADTTANFCSRSNYVSYEPLLAKIFAKDSDVINALRLASIDLQAEGGVRKLAPLVRAFFSRQDNSGLLDRRGELSSKRNDGFENGYWTPAHLVAKAMAEIDTRRKADVAGLQQWKTARSGLVDQLLAFERTGDVSTTRLKSNAQAKLVPEALSSLAEELRKQKANGSFERMVTGGLESDTRSLLNNPLLAGTLKTVALMRKDGKAEQATLKVLFGALDPSDTTRFMSSMASVADLVQALNDESSLRTLLPALAPALEPSETGTARATLALLSQTAKMDPDRRLTQLVSRLVSPLGSGTRTPLDIITATISEVSRVDPTKSGAAFTSEDTKRILAETREFLANKDSGLARMIDIIQKRNVQ